ncbi:hypothetical protein QP178_05585 [Sphingomonas aurantiaca]|uniref:hypothetical protein n=1 Tax=Sphingomonas aurantiaca TaxID=185949 RepID=UPI002FE1CF1B
MKLIATTLVSAQRAPAASLDAAILVARKVSESGSSPSRDSLAVAMGNKKASGNANNKILAAQHFGLIQRGPEGTYSMTDLGRRCVSATAREEDFRNAISKVRPFARVVADLGWQFSTDDAATIDAALKRAGLPTGAVVEARRVLVRSIAVVRVPRSTTPSDVAAPKQDDASPGGDGARVFTVRPRPRVRAVPASTPEPQPQPGSERLASEPPVDDGPVAFVDIPAIGALLGAAPALGVPWSRIKQDDFVEAMRHLIRFSYGPGE